MLVHRDHMEKLMDRMYDAYRKHGALSHQSAQRVAEYNAWVAKSNSEWDCCIADPDLHSLHWDVYKDHCGIRPRWFMTQAQVRASLELFSKSDSTL